MYDPCATVFKLCTKGFSCSRGVGSLCSSVQVSNPAVDESKPDGLHVVVPDVAARIDAIVTEIAVTGWRESPLATAP